MALLSVLLLLAIASQAIATATSATYTAAVYEHRRCARPGRPVKENLMCNLEIYKKQIKIAQAQGVDIIVFPEAGVIPYELTGYTRDGLLPYLQVVPDPAKVSYNPCDNPNQHNTSDILEFASCSAKSGNMYVVINIGEVKWCESETDCPTDGRFQYNTNIVFDREGKLIARYRKAHLFLESQMNQAAPEYITFETDFGAKFGVFTCFDIAFKEPAVTLTEKYGVTDIVYPTAWVDELPFFLSIQTQQSWALGRGVNLLAADLNMPKGGAMGSGIFSGTTGALIYSYAPAPNGRLLTAKVPLKRNSTVSAIIYDDLTVFNSTVLPLIPADVTRVCQGEFCCEAMFEHNTNKPLKGYNYRLMVFNGNRTIARTYHWGARVCAIVQCRNESLDSCGKYPVDIKSNSLITLNLTAVSPGNGVKPYFNPSVLATDYGLVPTSSWSFSSWVEGTCDMGSDDKAGVLDNSVKRFKTVANSDFNFYEDVEEFLERKENGGDERGCAAGGRQVTSMVVIGPSSNVKIFVAALYGRVYEWD